MQRQHQLATQPLPQWVARNQVAQLAHQLPRATKRQISVDAILYRNQTNLLEAEAIAACANG